MAFLIVGMLAVGKYMVGLENDHPLRFPLIQSHKTFGVLILLLAVLRLLWRLTHKAPPHPAQAPRWEKRLAGTSHLILYALLFLAPLSGWMLVSISPHNVDTLLFDTIPWPHIPVLDSHPDKESAVHLYKEIHEITTGILIALLFLHIAGALKHHLIDKDTVLSGMSPFSHKGAMLTLLGSAAVVALASVAAVYTYKTVAASSVIVSSGTSEVTAVASVMGSDTIINFPESSVTLELNTATPANSRLSASVKTASLTSDNAQVQSGLPGTEWFDSENYPTANFESTSFKRLSDTEFSVEGTLSIKDIVLPHTFTLVLSDTNGNTTANGEFLVDRLAYQLGMQSQPTAEYVDAAVTVVFEFVVGGGN